MSWPAYVLLAASLVGPVVSQAGRRSLAVADLRAFTYDLGATSNVDGGKVTLANGTWTDQAGGSAFYLHPVPAFGDLDGDGQGDAIAILVESSVSTGSFYYMFALARRDGAAVQLGEPEWLGDRTVIQRATIDRKGIISVRYVTHAPGDAACCPTMRIEDRFRIENGKLTGITK